MGYNYLSGKTYLTLVIPKSKCIICGQPMHYTTHKKRLETYKMSKIAHSHCIRLKKTNRLGYLKHD